ncbi:MAG TPA: single-stranded DNA-binding protein, partial [Acidothermaceae bacterium]
MFDTQVTVVGNLVAEPRLAFTNDGQAVASFRLASTPRRFDRATGEWKDGDTLFTSVTCWRALAENVSASLKKGSSVIVLGRLSVRPYETRDGAQRQSVA